VADNSAKTYRKNRDELIEEYFSLGDKLRKQILHRAFLSVDLAGATKMKVGEDALAIEVLLPTIPFIPGSDSQAA